METVTADRTEALEREQSVRDAQATPKEIGGIPPVRGSTNQEAETPVEAPAVETPKEEITVPKWRFDEVAHKYNELKSQITTKTEAPKSEVDIDKVIDAKLAPIKVQLEVNDVLQKYPDFGEYAPQALEEIKANPGLSLEKAYKLVKFSDIESKAKTEGEKQAYQTIEKKQSLQFERSGRRVEQKPVEELLSDKSVPLSEIAKMLPRG